MLHKVLCVATPRLLSDFLCKSALQTSSPQLADIPKEVTYHGILLPFCMLLSAPLAMLLAGNLFIPILYKMRVVSVYEV